MNQETKTWIRYFIVMFRARAIQLYSSDGRWAVEAASQAAAFDRAADVMTKAQGNGKLPQPQELGFGDGFPPIAEAMLAEILDGSRRQ